MAKEHKIWVVQDLAYADLVYDGYEVPVFFKSPELRMSQLNFTLCQKVTTCQGGESALCW